MFERQTLDKLMAEQNFSNSNRADPSTAAKLGKMAGVDYIIIGAITQFGNETKKQGVGGNGGTWHGYGVGGFGHSNSKAEVGISARIVNVNTGEIVAVAEGSGQSSRSSTSLLGGGGDWRGAGGGNVDFGSSNFQETIIGEATKAAVDQLSGNIIADAPKLTMTAVKIDGVVAAVDSGQIILNMGSDAGVKVGDQFEIIRVTKEIKDPSTGEVIRRLTTTVGFVKATDVTPSPQYRSSLGFRLPGRRSRAKPAVVLDSQTLERPPQHICPAGVSCARFAATTPPPQKYAAPPASATAPRGTP